MLEIRAINPSDNQARGLISQSDALMASLYPAESNHLDNPEELAQPNVLFVGAYFGRNLVGCGAVKILDDDGRYGEIKRLFVTTAYRSRSISGTIMDCLEKHLVDRGIPLARLETGVKQLEAIGLYRKRGYVLRGPFGTYRKDPWSVYMEKVLLPDAGQTEAGA